MFNESSSSTFQQASSSSSTVQQLPNRVKFTSTSGKKELWCSMCSACYSDRSFLDRHVISLHILARFRCYKCKALTGFKKCLLEHVESQHSNFCNDLEYQNTLTNACNYLIYQCCFCKYISNQRHTVINHLMEEHYDEFEREEVNELRDSHSESPDSLSELLIPESLIKFREKVAKEVSLQSTNSNDQTLEFRCVRCLKRFSEKVWLILHVCKPKRKNVAVERRPNLNVVNGFFHCTHPKCSQVFTKLNLFKEHTNLHHSQH
jgi:hypothetical protein